MDVKYTCRTCLRHISEKSEIYDLDTLDANSEIICIQNNLYYCVPELDLTLTRDKTICTGCIAALNKAYEFKTRCLRIQEFIINHVKGRDLTLREVIEESDVQLEETASVIIDKGKIKDDVDSYYSNKESVKQENSNLIDAEDAVCVNCNEDVERIYEEMEFTVEFNFEIAPTNCNNNNIETPVEITCEFDNCPFTFYDAVDFQKHVKDYHNNRQDVYNCTLCAYNAENRVDMLIHIKESHCDKFQNSLFESGVEEDSQSGQCGGGDLTDSQCEVARAASPKSDVLDNVAHVFCYIENQETIMTNNTSQASDELVNSNTIHVENRSEVNSDDERYDCLDVTDNQPEQDDTLTDCDITDDKIAETTESECNKNSHKKDKNISYKCIACNFTFATENELDIHIKMHLNEGYYKCGICNYLSRDKEITLDHENKSHNLTNEENSDYIFIQSEQENIDVITTQNNKLNEADSDNGADAYSKQEGCDVLTECDILMQQNIEMTETIAGNQSSQYNEIETAVAETKLTCDKCSFISYEKQEYENHLLDNHNQTNNKRSCVKRINYYNNFKTPLYVTVNCTNSKKKKKKPKYFNCKCGYKTYKKSNLFEHYKSHRKTVKKIDDKKHKCAVCNFTADTRFEMNTHIISVHRGYYKCLICYYLSADRSIVLHHEREKHRFTKRYRCIHCSQKFTNRPSFKNHIKRAHLNKKKHSECRQCSLNILHEHTPLPLILNKKGVVKKKLKLKYCKICKKKSTCRKTDTHLEKKWSCKWCKFVAITKTQLGAHKRTHPESFSCSICNYDIDKRYLFKLHMVKTHSLTKYYTCENCCYHTIYKSSLKSHLETHQ